MSKLDDVLHGFDLTDEDSLIPSKKKIMEYKMRDLLLNYVLTASGEDMAMVSIDMVKK